MIQCAKEKNKKCDLLLGPFRGCQLSDESVQGSHPCLSVGTLDFGFVGQALAGLGVDMLVAELLPLVAVVDAGTAQRARQLVLNLCVVSNQLGYRIELCLAFLPQK